MKPPAHAESLAWFLYTGIAEREDALHETAKALRTDTPIPDGMDRTEFAAFCADLPGVWQESAQDAADRMAEDAKATADEENENGEQTDETPH